MKSKKNLLIALFFLILFLGSFLRLYRLLSLPPALFSDEVDAGYQALVFNSDQSDYFGNKFPLHFHSFADWRTSAYIYSIALFNFIFRNPELSVRLPAAIYGLLILPLIYLLIRQITQNKLTALFAMFSASLSPWLIHYSRSGFEVSGMLLSLLLGIYFWLLYLQKYRLSKLLLSAFFLILSTYFYSTAKLFLLLLFPILIIIWLKQISIMPKKHLIVTFIFSVILLLPLIRDTLRSQAGFRFSYISIYSEPNMGKMVDNSRYEDIYSDHQQELGVKTSLISKAFHNKVQFVWEKFYTNYLSAFSLNFLLLRGDGNLRHGFGGYGYLNLTELILILIGLYAYFSHHPKSQAGQFFLILLFISPLPYALTRDSLTPHATRLIIMVPSLIYFAAFGFNHLYRRLPFPRLFLISLVSLYLLGTFSFWHYYRYHYPQLAARSWHSGMKEAVVSSLSFPASKIYYSNSYEPFLPFFLFYQPYLPASLPISSHINHTANDFFDGTNIDDRYFFGRLNWSALPKTTLNLNSALFVIPRSELNNLTNSLPEPSFQILNQITKKYINQEEFLIIRFLTNED